MSREFRPLIQFVNEMLVADWNVDTGRVLYVNDETAEVSWEPPTDTEEYGTWTETIDGDGDVWYVADHEGYTLSAEEFGPLPE